ncbi:MAG: 4'-phosphopantetheinyl transferase superfamily protein [Bacteroidales bacterium]|nr:4'-phosphopantetheinyl transferase superfamily protein [Bacteroidales bacterium]
MINENINENRGLDIELISNQALKLKNKFLTIEEEKLLPKNDIKLYTTLFWSAKESVYKKINIKNIYLKSNINIEKIDKNNQIIKTKLIINENVTYINVFWLIFDSIVITYTD